MATTWAAGGPAFQTLNSVLHRVRSRRAEVDPTTGSRRQRKGALKAQIDARSARLSFYARRGLDSRRMAEPPP
jgi:hypothetical protein